MDSAKLPARVFCGVGWAEGHHDIALVSIEGEQLARQRIGDDVSGLAQLVNLLAEHGDTGENPIPVAIETSRGLLVSCLRATGRPVFAINPLAVARYRDRHSVARKKSDAVDAAALANILRTDMAMHRPLPQDSELAQAIAVLARAQQDAVWDRNQAQNKLRSQLREFYPAILDAQFLPPRPPRLRLPSSHAANCGLSSNTPAASEELMLRPIDSMRSSTASICTICRWSRRPSGSRPQPCSDSWNLPALTQRISRFPAPTPSSNILMQKLSSAFQDLGP